MAKLDRKLKKERGKPISSLDVYQAKGDSKKKWDKKMKEKERIKRVRLLAQQLKDDINAEQKRAADTRKANAERKRENEKKNMVVQKISNEKAIRKLSPKHRKSARIFMLHELN
ncbi:rRNA-processing protein CGR1 [Angomonas deanei]|uniref:Coiled-coil domain-containing protein 86 n=1 Tax=Angomonas deanei TaxID=59799 RepID=A0A7G2CCA8_9TRYP|nr:rRNA-processing protein CGR1 [Angomonas deanei]CAD2216554.1 Cgr1 family, putative [Angomonas deanei]|eukprot:EPY42221.1 rRNA-processing protein CGR1 [Angomonas deanei]